jgi:hypothetical protein
MKSNSQSPKQQIFIRQKIINIYHAISAFGIDLKKIINAVFGVFPYMRDFSKILKQQKTSRISFPISEVYPVFIDRCAEIGVIRHHYFQQDLYVAQKIFHENPVKHVDIGSRVDGFIANVATFRELETFDIRPLGINIKNIIFNQCDLMQEIEKRFYDYCDSLSCLHAIEHFGLGRYGDQIQYEGYLMGLENIAKILKTSGKFYLSVPIGPQRIVFNAHRVFSISYLLQLFKNMYKIDVFSYIDDTGKFHQDVPIKKNSVSTNYGCQYGCGIFEMTKL